MKSKSGINMNREIIIPAVDFDPMHIFECGQAFRWYREADGSYTAVAFGKVINVLLDGDRLVFRNTDREEFKHIWSDYFDMGRDYSAIKTSISEFDELKKASEFGNGIRILKQEAYETIISFIISANNQIPRIKNSIEKIANRYGDYIGEDECREYYSFPKPEVLAELDPKELREYARVGFRDVRIVETSKLIRDKVLDLEKASGEPTPALRNKLIELPGVGPKVADCILLFAYSRGEVFPVDVWIKRVMETLFIGKEVKKSEVVDYAHRYFGEMGGFAQQYLFYYGRENAIGKANKKLIDNVPTD